MDDYPMDIQALLQDIDGNHGDTEATQPPQPPRPYSRSTSSSYTPQTQRLMMPTNASAPTNRQPPFHDAQAARPSDAYSYSTYNNTNLDTPDQELLAEPQPQLQWHWQANSSMSTLPAGRVSSLGPAAQNSSLNSFQQPKAQEQRRAVPGPTPHSFQYQLGQRHALPLRSPSPAITTDRYAHKPPARIHTSSPGSEPFPSSPSFVATQQRMQHETQHNNPSTVIASSRDLRPITASSMRDPNKGIVYDNCLHSPDMDEKNKFSTMPSPKPFQRHLNDQIGLAHAQPMVQGIPLVSLNEMPDRLRSVFRYPLFNAIQSKCFSTAYKSDDNLVVAAPTGGGKTAILEMAICRLIHGFQIDQYKIVYMAPTKSLCSERQRDWQSKFIALDLKCAELTGDTDLGQLRNVQSANIIITTPEKWDSMTRKWKDHARLMQMVKLFLIDEVHILKDSRGATLEAVVSRMKSVGSNLRFVALSATVPNSEDIATWLGKNHTSQYLPATREKFGEEFRPVRLQKHVVGISYRGNDFGFESACDPKLPAIIAKYSHRKPIMVFCITRKSTVNTAKLLANVWASKASRERHWEGPTQRLIVQDPELKNTLTSGVAFHHAGLEGPDRHTVEQGFLEGQVNVICCTSTLAVGVNLPCHMVIIKNTVSYQDDGIKEYADLEIMQMLGRAGRPQFDSTAVAVIITKQEKLKKYEKLVSGEERLESCLHLNLIDHLNAEIGLGTIYDLYTAKRWLAGTFLYVRLGLNPEHYKLDGDAGAQSVDDRIENICRRDLQLLGNTQLIISGGKLKATEFGDAMARYFVKFQTMKVLMDLQPRSKMSDILHAIVQAEEFHDVRLRANEKKLFKEINGANGIKFPVKVDLAMHAHKRSLIIQSELGGVDFPSDEQYAKHKRQFIQDKTRLFLAIHRLICCTIDCQIHLRDSVTVRHALELARSFSARVWDNSPYQMKQIAQIGLVAIRKLAMGGIHSIEALEAAEPQRIEMLMSKNPPFGNKLLANLRDFPKLRVSVKMMGKESVRGRPTTIKIKAECGFMNDTVPTLFHRRPIYVCLLTERSDGFMVDFRRISAKKLINGQDLLMSAEMLNHTQYITCHVMCDGIAGTMRSAELKPELPAYLFPPQSCQKHAPQLTREKIDIERNGDISEQQGASASHTSAETLEDDEFGDDDFKDQEVINAVKEMDFSHIDEFDPESTQMRPKASAQENKAAGTQQTAWNPERLENGKWACNHKCKDKTVCKHMCCREGVDKAPKAPKGSFISAASLVNSSHTLGHRGKNEGVGIAKKRATPSVHGNDHEAEIETVNLAGSQMLGGYEKKLPKALRNLDRLHDSVSKGRSTALANTEQPLFDYTKGGQQQMSFPNKDDNAPRSSDKPSTDYDADWMDDLPSPSALLGNLRKNPGPLPEHALSTDDENGWSGGLAFPSALLRQNDAATKNYPNDDSQKGFDLSQFNDDESDLEAAMVGLSDSVTMQKGSRVQAAAEQTGSQAKKDSRWCSSPEELPPRIHHRPTFDVESSSTSGMFFSTDSPDKLEKLPQKRKECDRYKGEDVSQSAPVPKRLRVSDEGVTPKALSSTEKPAKAACPVIKAGLPAWVYEFDPAFIAEWQDIVDFV